VVKQGWWRSAATRRVWVTKLRCRRGRHNWQLIRNAESGDAYKECRYCHQIEHQEFQGTVSTTSAAATIIGGPFGGGSGVG
jgi:hypothetical protein